MLYGFGGVKRTSAQRFSAKADRGGDPEATGGARLYLR